MPIYDYVCAACGHRWEVLHGLNESGPQQCPLCGGRVSRAFVPPTIHFKGSGWARMDRRTSAARPKRSSGSDTSSEPAPRTGGEPAAGASREPAAGTSGESSAAAGAGED